MVTNLPVKKKFFGSQVLYWQVLRKYLKNIRKKTKKAD